MTEQDKLKEMENKIYDTYYENNPDGDARFDIWPAVMKAKKEGIEALQEIINEVECGCY